MAAGGEYISLGEFCSSIREEASSVAKTIEELKAEFHQTYDYFPGVARLIDRQHKILAANIKAQKAGFKEGMICAKIGTPESHRECKFEKMFETGKAQTDHAIPDKIRGWYPIEGFPDVCIHFGLPLPEDF